jgi:hypothetical protein
MTIWNQAAYPIVKGSLTGVFRVVFAARFFTAVPSLYWKLMSVWCIKTNSRNDPPEGQDCGRSPGLLEQSIGGSLKVSSTKFEPGGSMISDPIAPLFGA